MVSYDWTIFAFAQTCLNLNRRTDKTKKKYNDVERDVNDLVLRFLPLDLLPTM